MTKTTRRFSILFGLFALLVTVAGVVYAQGRQGGMMGEMMSMMQDCPMMKSMQQGPAAALQHEQELGLTADQVQRLEALQKSAHPGHMQMMGQMQAIHQEIAKATEGERFDEAAARTAFGRMGAMHTEMGVAMLRTRHQTQQILTAEQREKLSKLGGGMMGMHGMMGGMDMKDCPMMGGGMNGMHMERSGS
ncbi:MAG: Spy/CpxP family protein refolding chaperone [Gemmatimonadota bacterium]